MSAEERKTVQSIADAVNILPPDKKEYIIGYAEGVLAMAGEAAKANPSQDSA